jgi:hypothetical protein
MKSFRLTPRITALLNALEERGIGIDHSDRIRKGIECLASRHKVKI